MLITLNSSVYIGFAVGFNFVTPGLGTLFCLFSMCDSIVHCFVVINVFFFPSMILL